MTEKAEKDAEKKTGVKKRKFKVLYPLMKDGETYKIGDVKELALTETEEMKLIGESLEEVK